MTPSSAIRPIAAPRLEGEERDQHRHHDDPAADPEKRPEEARREADDQEAHGPIL
jgi:hypothetical protein